MADASLKVVHASSISHIVSGASMAATVFSSSADIDTALVGTGNLSSYPRCDVTLKYIPASTTATTLMTIPLYRRDLNVNGSSTLDDGVPATAHSNKFMGVFSLPVSLSTGTYYMTLTDVPLPGGNTDCEFYIQNGLTNAIPIGWDLTVSPKTDFADEA